MSEEKKIIIDEDWKSQVEAEKEAAQAAQESEPASDEQSAPYNEADPPMPPASLQMLISSLATEAMMAMGQMPHPITGEVTPRRNQAKYLIDTIGVLKEKTVGNIAAEESAGIEELLHTLRMAFVAMPPSGEPTTPPTADSTIVQD